MIIEIIITVLFSFFVLAIGYQGRKNKRWGIDKKIDFKDQK